MFNNIRRGEEKVLELDKKAKAFAAVIEDVNSFYGEDAPRTTSLRIDAENSLSRQHVQQVLQECKKEFQDYEKEVTKLLHDRNTKRRGFDPILTWKESVAAPTFERIEASIDHYQTSLQSLMQVHHG